MELASLQKNHINSLLTKQEVFHTSNASGKLPQPAVGPQGWSKNHLILTQKYCNPAAPRSAFKSSQPDFTRDGLKHPPGQQRGASRGAACPWHCCHVVSARRNLLICSSPARSHAPQKLRAVNTAWATKLRQPQSLCYGWVTRKQHFDEQSSSRTIFKAFLKTDPEPDLFPQESQRFEQGEIPLCARTWVWKQL